MYTSTLSLLVLPTNASVYSVPSLRHRLQCSPRPTGPCQTRSTSLVLPKRSGQYKYKPGTSSRGDARYSLLSPESCGNGYDIMIYHIAGHRPAPGCEPYGIPPTGTLMEKPPVCSRLAERDWQRSIGLSAFPGTPKAASSRVRPRGSGSCPTGKPFAVTSINGLLGPGVLVIRRQVYDYD